ncbi:MAG: hypothetical protein M1144_05520 [Candidatus Thermoplasmatota archaeon]|jgi:hypothetical protein|nr:hypothetical protein [Candidatus Thermoplasmatota archaeon]MCL5984620.1 hypothetical protein [Candidatus Thermoplasmatota archaeon]
MDRTLRRFRRRGSTAPTRLLLLAGAVILAAMAASAYLVGEGIIVSAAQPAVQAVVTLPNVSPASYLWVNYSNPGNVPVSAPLVVLSPILNGSGNYLPLNPEVHTGQYSVETYGLGVPSAQSPPNSACSPSLTLSHLTFGNYSQVAGGALQGGGSLSVFFSGGPNSSSWGMGIFLATAGDYSPLVVVQETGSGNPSATVSYYEYDTWQHFYLVAQSPPFPLDNSRGWELSLAISADGNLTAFVNNRAEFTHAIEGGTGSLEAFGIWTPAPQGIQGIYLQSGGRAAYEGLPGSCGHLLFLPFESLGFPQLSATQGTLHLLGPYLFPSVTVEPVYVLEEFVVQGSQPFTTAVYGGTPLVLPVGGNVTLQIPWDR